MLRETRIRIAEENRLIYNGIGEDGELMLQGDDVDWTNYTEACDAYELEHPYEEEEDWKKDLDRDTRKELRNESDAETITDEPSEDYPLGGSLERYDIERDRELTE